VVQTFSLQHEIIQRDGTLSRAIYWS